MYVVFFIEEKKLASNKAKAHKHIRAVVRLVFSCSLFSFHCNYSIFVHYLFLPNSVLCFDDSLRSIWTFLFDVPNRRRKTKMLSFWFEISRGFFFQFMFLFRLPRCVKNLDWIFIEFVAMRVCQCDNLCIIESDMFAFTFIFVCIYILFFASSISIHCVAIIWQNWHAKCQPKQQYRTKTFHFDVAFKSIGKL